ncbi:unnamed protein product [Gongylonema pulchrum]|uniref:DUF1053 domain-containing protein n=1 Tax=Gongylonema pulchrum TaxID=637853 RepID=A0A183D6K6_9BILA|nr:unnamed protein product [Gongylonema pulchrum]
MKLLEKKSGSNSAQILHYSECLDKNAMAKSPVVEERRKSASLQALPPQEMKPLSAAERIGGKASRDLVNGSSGRGSKSSGLQNAPSLTRFDTDNRDFDERLAMVIQNADIDFGRGFWMHNDSLNKWTLQFNESDIEERYRAHFAESADRHWSSRDGMGRRKNVTFFSEKLLKIDFR